MGRQQIIFSVLVLSLITVGPRSFANGPESPDGEGPKIKRITINGSLKKPDKKRVRKMIRSNVGAPLNENTLRHDRERIEDTEQFTVNNVETSPDSGANNSVNISFEVYYASVSLETSLNKNGGLQIKLGPHQLLAESNPKRGARRVRGPEINDIDNKFRWVRSAEQSWNAENQTFKAQHKWGSYVVRYMLRENRVDMEITVHNGMSSRLDLVGITLSHKFNFPSLPNGFWWEQGRVTTPLSKKGPPLVFGDYDQGIVAACLVGEFKKVNFGFKQKKLWTGFHHLPAGETRTVRASLRFGLGGAAGGNRHKLVHDVYKSYRKKHPRTLEWPDRRPIGALHPSSAAKGLFKAGNPKNPRGWKFAEGVDIRTEDGRKKFKKNALEWARSAAKVSKRNNAQGVIVWSIEGQQYPHATSYIGAPNKIGRLAPEMDAVADEFFQVFEEAGLRTGVTIRPQKLKIPEKVPESDTVKPHQQQQWDGDRIPVEDILETLDRKLTYAKKRWGCSIFYVDSNKATKWEKNKKGKWKPVRRQTLPVEIFAELHRRHPDCLIIPEFGYPAYWAYTAPLARTLVRQQRIWSDPFSVNPNVLKSDLSKPENVKKAAGAIKRGEIILFRGWFGDSHNKVIRRLYKKHHNPEWHGKKAKW